MYNPTGSSALASETDSKTKSAINIPKTDFNDSNKEYNDDSAHPIHQHPSNGRGLGAVTASPDHINAILITHWTSLAVVCSPLRQRVAHGCRRPASGEWREESGERLWTTPTALSAIWVALDAWRLFKSLLATGWQCVRWQLLQLKKGNWEWGKHIWRPMWLLQGELWAECGRAEQLLMLITETQPQHSRPVWLSGLPTGSAGLGWANRFVPFLAHVYYNLILLGYLRGGSFYVTPSAHIVCEFFIVAG